MNTPKQTSKQFARKITVTALLSALSAVLMFLNFSIPIMPSFIKLDFSELPALIASFSLGPLSGVCVCFIKNLINLLFTQTGGVGELSNFILGVAFVLPAGLFYKKLKTRGGALIGSVIGALLMSLLGFLSNMYIVYPLYAQIMSMDAILNAYKLINPNINYLWEALLIFNVPFTFFKGLLSVIITFLIYKKISPVIKGISR